MFEWLSSTRSEPPVADGDREVEALVLDAQLVEVAQRLPGEVADLGVVALGLEFGDDDDGEHDGVLGEAEDRLGIAQQHRGVEHVGALAPASASTSRCRGLAAGGLSSAGHCRSIPG